jgi:hypothetical protein
MLGAAKHLRLFFVVSELAVIRSNQTQTSCHAERNEASAVAFPNFRIGGNTTAPKQTPHCTVMLSEAKHLRLLFQTSELAVNRPERPNCEALGFLGSDLSMGAIFVIRLFLFFNLTYLLRYRNIMS